MQAAVKVEIKEDDEEKVPVFYHSVKSAVIDKAHTLLPDFTEGVLLEEVEKAKKTIVGSLLMNAMPKTGKQTANINGALLLVNSIFDKVANPRALTPFQVVIGSYLDNIIPSTAMDSLHHLGVCASKRSVKEVKDGVVAQTRSLVQQGVSCIDIFDNLEYREGRRDFAQDSRPVVIHTVNLLQLKHPAAPVNIPLWRISTGKSVEEWCEETLFKSSKEMDDWTMDIWDTMESRKDRSFRVGRPETLKEGEFKAFIMPPILPGDLKDVNVAGDPGYKTSFGKPEQMEKVLGHLKSLSHPAGSQGVRLSVGDEQSFETMMILHFVTKSE